MPGVMSQHIVHGKKLSIRLHGAAHHVGAIYNYTGEAQRWDILEFHR